MKHTLFVFVLAVLIGSVMAPAAHAATALTGWAWTDNFGWISFSSANSGAGGGPYAVSLDKLSGAFSGYAWSDNAGWISFNSSDIPAACTGSRAPQVNLTTGASSGYAYAMVYGASADGCIELSGTNHTSPDMSGNGGITYDPSSGSIIGYAWGSNSPTTGPGWIQFLASAGPTTLSGTCQALTAHQNVLPGTNVTFEGDPTNGTPTYQYSWNNAPYASSNNYTVSYSSSGAGPTVAMRDSTGVTTQSPAYCPNVTVLAPINQSASSIQIGRTAATANATTYSAKQNNPFAVAWNFTTSNDYTCTPNVAPDPGSQNWNTYWKSISLNPVDNGDGTETFSGNTGSTLTAGAVSGPVPAGIYQFGISCMSQANTTQGIDVILKVNSSSESEI